MARQVLSLGQINGLISDKQRQNRKITQKYISEQMGIEEATLCKKLRGYVPFKESETDGELTLLAMILGVSINDFYKTLEG
jgi:transcriptional regulator with XRE-family HTH domain